MIWQGVVAVQLRRPIFINSGPRLVVPIDPWLRRTSVMASIKLVLLFVAVAAAMAMTASSTDADFSGYCSDESIPAGSSYWTSLNQTLTDLIQNTGDAKEMTYSVKNGDDTVSAFGRAQCFSGLSPDACRTCIRELVKRAWQECGDAIAAMLVVNNQCTIRYQDSPLL